MLTEAVLRGQQVVLVPSTPDHVEVYSNLHILCLLLNQLHQRYHRWMIDPELLKDTRTDPLTLEQVYEMESTSITTSNDLNDKLILCRALARRS